MYCTLQEAYNVPSFDPPTRKKKCAPDAQAKASAIPYDPYRRDGGNGLGDFTMYKYDTPRSVEERQLIHGNKPLQRRIPHETFQNYAGESQTDSMVRSTYKGMERNRTEYCDTYGVCASDQIENFVNSAPYSKEGTQGLNTKGGAGSPSLVGTNNGTCGSSPDFYEVPLSEETKKQFQQAMNTALDQKTSSTTIPEPKLRYDDMKNVTGYYDEDLEQYLKSSESSSIPKRFPMNADAKHQDILHHPDKSPLQKTIKRFSEHSIQQPLKPENLAGTSEPLYNFKTNASFGWDLALFILAGILVIILIDQLFKMGVMLGMRHTIELLEPYMKEIRAIAK